MEDEILVMDPMKVRHFLILDPAHFTLYLVLAMKHIPTIWCKEECVGLGHFPQAENEN